MYFYHPVFVQIRPKPIVKILVQIGGRTGWIRAKEDKSDWVFPPIRPCGSMIIYSSKRTLELIVGQPPIDAATLTHNFQ